MTVDYTKKVVTHDGREVRILCTDGPGAQPVIGLIDDLIFRWSISGKNGLGQHLRNATRKEKRFLNYYGSGHVSIEYTSKEVADRNAMWGREACLEFEVEVDE